MRTFFTLLILGGLVLLATLFWARSFAPPQTVFYGEPVSKGLWRFQSIDTMKFSRDMAREKAHNTSFDAIIEQQMQSIAETGATHVAIATPYDEEFVPYLTRWVTSARAHGLSVWFRGNWSGWEGWFNYPRITREAHWDLTKAFIEHHPDLFKNGDAFSACPECENGGPGDPRRTGDVVGHRAFLIAEYRMMQSAFEHSGKNVRVNLFSMNADVARLVMDRDTTTALGGVVTIDHYVKSPEQLAKDVGDIARQSGGQVILGEFGAPIPDIQGSLTREEQATWIAQTLQTLSHVPGCSGANYWLSVGGSTALWLESGEARPAVAVLTKFFQPPVFFGQVKNDLGQLVVGASVQIRDRKTTTNQDGYFELPVPDFAAGDALTIGKAGYDEQILSLRAGNIPRVTLIKANKSFTETIAVFLRQLWGEGR